jgi:hypothetical protein
MGVLFTHMAPKRRPAKRASRKPASPRKPSRKTSPASPAPAHVTAAGATAGTFTAPVRSPRTGEMLLLVHADGNRDPLLDDYLGIMAAHGHVCEELSVPGEDPFAARAAIRRHPAVRRGEAGGVVLFGKAIPSFTVRYFYPGSTLVSRGHADLPFGSDFAFFDSDYEALAPDSTPGWDIRRFAALLDQAPARYAQNQWVARIFRLDQRYLQNLAETVPPQQHNMLVVNADPPFDDAELMERIRRSYRGRYGLLSQGHIARFGFLGVDFQENGLADYLRQNLSNATFLSIADHGDSNNLNHLPPAQNGIAQLPDGVPDLVEYGACAAGDWMEQDEPTKSLAEVTMQRGALSVIAAQCLLAWNYAKGFVDPAPGTNPLDQESFNVAPWLDVWPSQGSVGRAQAFSVTRNLSFLAGSSYTDRPFIAFQMLCGHSLFGDGTLEFQSH